MIIVVLGVILPVGYFLTDFETSLSTELWLPSSAGSMKANDQLKESSFGVGSTAPYKIIFDGYDSNQKITTSDGFDVMHLVYDDFSLYADNASPNDEYTGISIWNGTLISYDTYQEAISCGETCDNETLLSIAYINAAQTTEDNETTYITLIQDIDPYSNDGIDWLTSARDIIDDLEDENLLQGFNVYIEGGCGVAYDSKVKTYDSFPWVVGITLCVVLVFMIGFFKSVVTALRSTISIIFTLLFAYGSLVLVYRKGIFDWLGFDGLESYSESGKEGEIHFMVPVMAFNICVGLSLDYDIFFISRILEYRLLAWDNTSTILLGLQGTGHIITAAGVIMAVAFGGLMLSSLKILDQFGFILTASVLLDTFVIRTIIVPILFSWTDKYSWWPRFLPTPDKSVVNHQEIHQTIESDDS